MMQNPALLDTEWGLTHSSQQRAIEASRLSLPESFKDPSEQVHTAENRTTDLEQYFGPRPPEAGPGDQLVLRKVSYVIIRKRYSIWFRWVLFHFNCLVCFQE